METLLQVVPVGAYLVFEARLCGRRAIGLEEKVGSVGSGRPARIFKSKKGVWPHRQFVEAFVIGDGDRIEEFPSLSPANQLQHIFSAGKREQHMDIDDHHLVLQEKLFELVSSQPLGNELGTGCPLLDNNGQGRSAQGIDVLLLRQPDRCQIAGAQKLEEAAMQPLQRSSRQRAYMFPP
jgi:hypothetical protein